MELDQKMTDVKPSQKLPEVFDFSNVDLEGRLEQLRAILSSEASTGGSSFSDSSSLSPMVTTARDIKTKWSIYLETLVEPSGWLGVWTPSTTGDEVKIIDVVNIDFRTLTAVVEILDADDIIEDNEVLVPLMELTPVKNQSKEFNVLTTAMCLDALQFFYRNLWKPWDVNDDRIEDWVEEHLENRINYYGLDDDDPAKIKLDRLSLECVKIQKTLEVLNEEDDDENEESPLSDEQIERIIERYELGVREEAIRREAEVLETPYLRFVKIRLEEKKKLKGRKDKNQRKVALVVGRTASISELSKILEEITKEYKDDLITIHRSLQEAIESSYANDVLLIASPGRHEIGSWNDLSEGVVLKGLVDDVVITSDEFHNPGLPLMEFLEGSKSTLKRITVEGPFLSKACVILVHPKAELFLDKVKIIQGDIGLLTDGTVDLIQSGVEKCQTGIELGPEAVLRGYEVDIRDCDLGIVVDGASRLTFKKVKITKNRKRDFILHRPGEKLEAGNCSLLEGYPNICLEDETLISNVTLDPSD